MLFMKALTKRFKLPNRKYFQFSALFISFCYNSAIQTDLLWLFHIMDLPCQITEEQWLSQKYIKYTKYSEMTIAHQGGQRNYIILNILCFGNDSCFHWQQCQISFRVDAHGLCMQIEWYISQLNVGKMFEFLINIFVYTFSTVFNMLAFVQYNWWERSVKFEWMHTTLFSSDSIFVFVFKSGIR